MNYELGRDTIAIIRVVRVNSDGCVRTLRIESIISKG